MTSKAVWSSLLVALACLAAACGKEDPAQRDSDQEPETCEEFFRDDEGRCSLGALEGRVTLEGRLVHTGIRVGLSGSDRVTETGVDGRFRLEKVKPGAWSLDYSAEGFGSDQVEGLVVRATAITEVAPSTLRQEARSSSIMGFIWLTGADDHRGTVVTVDSSSVVTTTASDGSFHLGDVLPGVRVLRAFNDGYASLEVEVTVEANEDTHVEYQLDSSLPHGTLVGTVTDVQSGLPVSQASIVLAGTRHSARTGADGTYRIEYIEPDMYRVQVGGSGWNPVVEPSVSIRSGEVTRLDVAMEPAATVANVSGLARRMHAPVLSNGGIEVALRIGTTVFRTTTAADGRWTFAGLETGVYELTASTALLPSVVIKDIFVHVGDNDLPDIVLGPARKLIDRHSSGAHVFSKARKALVTFSGESASFLYDAATETFERMAGEAMSVLAVDPEERYATLKGRTGLFRLDIRGGLLEPVPDSEHESLVAERMLTIFSTSDGKLFLLRTGDLQRQVIETGSRVEGVSPYLVFHESQGWRSIRVRTAKGEQHTLADFSVGWVAPVRDWMIGPSGGSTFASLGSFPSEAGSELYWGDLATKEYRLVATGVMNVSTSGGLKSIAVLKDARPDGTTTLATVDMRTGAAVDLLQGVRAIDGALGDAIWRVRVGQALHWATSDPPATGLICAQAQVVAIANGTVACLSGLTSPYELQVLKSGSREVETWSQAASWVQSSAGGLIQWRGEDGNIRARLAAHDATLTLPCSTATFFEAMPQGRLAICGGQGGTHHLDFASGTIRALSETSASRCSVSPSGELGVCSHPCGGGECTQLHDFRQGLSTAVGRASGEFAVVWGESGGAAIRVASMAFHGWAGAEGQRPQVATCSTEGYWTPLATEARYSLWAATVDGKRVCGPNGSLSETVATRWSMPHRIGNSKSHYLGGVIFDLDTGNHQRLLTVEAWVQSIDGVLFVHPEVGLLRITAPDSYEWLATDKPVREWREHGRLAFHVIQGDGSFDLLVVRDGGELTTVRRVTSRAPLGRWEVISHDWAPEDGSRGITFLDTTTLEARPLPVRMVPGAGGDGIVTRPDRIFFHSQSSRGATLHRAFPETLQVDDLGLAGKVIGGDAGGHLLVGQDWSWMEATPRSAAVLAGPASAVSHSSDGSMVFHAESPAATYWIERSALPD